MSSPNKFSAWPAEQILLCELIDRSPGDYVVEIGCFKGATSKILALRCAVAGKTLVCIDPWDGVQDGSDESVYQEFCENMKDVPYIVIRARSSDADTTPYLGKCALVFIDGLHTDLGAFSDMLLAKQLCAPNGHVAVHDYFDTGWPGVARAVDYINQGMAFNVLKYIPTAAECEEYCHGVSGLAYWKI